MRALTRLVDLILYTSLLTAACATGLCMATECLINGAAPALFTPLHTLIFGSSLLVYNAPRILRKPFTSEHNRHGFLRNRRTWYITSFIMGSGLTIASLPALSPAVLATCGILSLLAFSYSLPLLPLLGYKRLRDFGWLKIFTLASVWTIATSILPTVYHHKAIASYPAEILIRFSFIFTLCIIFDIRDMRADLSQNLYTLPNKLGIRNSYRLINVTLVLFVIFSGLQYTRYPSIPRFISALLTAIITRIVVAYLQRHPTHRAYAILADGVMLVYSLLILLT